MLYFVIYGGYRYQIRLLPSILIWRSPVIIRVMRIGIDLGGTKIEGIVLSSDGTICAQKRLPTPSGDYQATIKTVIDIVEDLSKKVELDQNTPLGVGIPGTISPATGLVKNSNSTCLNGKRLDADLSQASGRKVRLANDANCFSISEAIDGAAASYELVFGVILGTGVGGGLAFRSTVWPGPNAIAGEWGHNPLPWTQALDGFNEQPGNACYCGRLGCIETYLSGPGLVQDHERQTGNVEEPKDISNEQTMGRYEHRLARALASVINILDPDAIVLGGGLSNIQRLYENVPAIWLKWIFSDECRTPLLQNQHGDSSGVRGAAWLWSNEKSDIQ